MSKKSFEKAKKDTEKYGFGYYKLEMEADLGRNSDDDCESYECDDCYGDGYNDCYDCDGTGLVNAERPNGTDIEVECDTCGGEGRLECDSCGGSGEYENDDYCGDRFSNDWCEDFILKNVSDTAREALVFSKFYYDGSVDSEMTLTIPVKYGEYLVEYMKAFKMLSDEIGNGLRTGGAGLHISVIPHSSGGSYPAPRNSLDFRKWNNFEKQVTKLLPALFMLASADDVSRGLNYRKPQISDEDKYSAIFAYRRSSIEYRLFETCYDNPEMVLEYLEVIAKTLKYYYYHNKQVKEVGKSFGISDGDNKVSRFYQTPEKINILRTQLKYIRPEGKSVYDLMKSRNVPNITELNKLQSAKRNQLRKKWYADKKRIEVLKKAPLTEENKVKIAELSNPSNYRSYTPQEAELIVRGINTEQQSLVDYLNSNLFGITGRGQYTLTV